MITDFSETCNAAIVTK